jgi:DNA-binding transcriptional LysR family regulator
VRYRLALLESGLEAVRSGLCAVFIPHFIARLHNRSASAACRLVRRALPPGMAPVRHTVLLVRRTAGAEPHHYRAIARALRASLRA